ncbi:hypothetical protein TNCV_4988221 [Trichonephila clavipes]|nr:hypothetical protein TNCV_4988221 [Trichonephila clavipes]
MALFFPIMSKIAAVRGRSAVHETAGCSPSEILFGRELRLMFSRPSDAPLVLVEKLQARMEEMHHLANDKIGMASKKRKTRYDDRVT